MHVLCQRASKRVSKLWHRVDTHKPVAAEFDL